MIYFDNAASTPVFEEVTDYMHKIQAENFGNPSAPHAFGRKAKVLIEEARKSISKKLNVQASEIFFTSGGTEANNAILWGCARNLDKKVFISSPTEHPCVVNTLEAIVKYMPVEVHYLDVDNNGNVDIQQLEGLLQIKENAVVSLMHANNEIGRLTPMKDVVNLCKKHGALFHSDIVQTAGKYMLDIQALGVDFAGGSAHKFHGPKGVGFMYVRSPLYFDSFISGGMQERNMRAGTENVVGICGMAMALEIATINMNDTISYISSLKDELIKILQIEIPDIEFNGDPNNNSLYSMVNLSLPKRYNSEMLIANLDIEGIALSSGSACSSGSRKASRVLTAIGADPDRATLRVSFSRFNKIEEIHKLVKALKKLGSKA